MLCLIFFKVKLFVHWALSSTSIETNSRQFFTYYSQLLNDRCLILYSQSICQGLFVFISYLP